MDDGWMDGWMDGLQQQDDVWSVQSYGQQTDEWLDSQADRQADR